ncbi:LINE-1 retrotransposable element ORF2 protein [Linum grandiflorum]
MHLPKLKSDHRPIQVFLDNSNTPIRLDRPFRFNAAWLSHEDFNRLLGDEWLSGEGLVFSLQEFKNKLIAWNKDIFGNIFKRKRKLERDLIRLEALAETNQSMQVAAQETKVRNDLEVTLWQENLIWLQKSKQQWTLEGDRNTKFFHTSTLRRRAFNRIKSLKDNQGVWIWNQAELMDLARGYFIQLFQRSMGPRNVLHELNQRTRLNAQRATLSRELQPAEILAAIKAMGPLKSPGKDGFHPLFFQKCWDTVGPDLVNFVVACFRNPSLIPSINETIVVLIPKIDKPVDMTQFRPISLCSVVYKALTKCLANRIRSHMAQLIGPNETSFVPGRQISENIIILQEVVHTLRLKKGKRGAFVIKLDLSKAFDRLEWSFVEDTLRRANLPNKFIEIAMACISTPSTQIQWNGGLSAPFQPGRGLRQGCPLSPYLFTLCVERLSNLIMEKISEGTWAPFSLGRGGPALSHLFFADDLVLFGNATIDQCLAIKDCLDRFCEASGQVVSNEKSRIFFSKNVSPSLRRSICNSLTFHETHDLGRYLGVPILHGRTTKSTYQYILDRIDLKLAGWKCKNLSLVGRVTLAVSVLNAIPSYAMQTAVLPVDVCNKIDSRIRNFVWGSLPDERKPHLISWDVVCRPKDQGGLGLRKAKEMNDAFLMKLVWNILSQPDALWVQVLLSKYTKDSPEGAIPIRLTTSSALWRGIRRNWDTVLRGSTLVSEMDGIQAFGTIFGWTMACGSRTKYIMILSRLHLISRFVIW